MSAVQYKELIVEDELKIYKWYKGFKLERKARDFGFEDNPYRRGKRRFSYGDYEFYPTRVHVLNRP